MASQNVSSDGQTAQGPTSVDWSLELARHERWLRTALWARLRNAEAVDEVMQEVALAAVRQAAPLHDPRKAGPWLYQVAVRQALVFRRRTGRRCRLVQTTPDDGMLADPQPAEGLGWLMAEERQQLVRQVLRELGPRDAEILLLKYTEHWSYHQIAEHLGIRHSAVESRLHRARMRMRERLARYEVVEARI